MNNFSCVGWLANDPELRQAGKSRVTRFTVALCGKRGDQDQPDYAMCEIWDSAADLVARDFRKGDLIFIESASLRTERWEKDGRRHSRNIFRVNRFSYPPRSFQKRQQSEVV